MNRRGNTMDDWIARMAVGCQWVTCVCASFAVTEFHPNCQKLGFELGCGSATTNQQAPIMYRATSTLYLLVGTRYRHRNPEFASMLHRLPLCEARLLLLGTERQPWAATVPEHVTRYLLVVSLDPDTFIPGTSRTASSSTVTRSLPPPPPPPTNQPTNHTTGRLGPSLSSSSTIGPSSGTCGSHEDVVGTK